MRLELFRGRDLASVHAQARNALGLDAIIIHSRTRPEGMRMMIEVLAAEAMEIARFRRMLTPPPPHVSTSRTSRRGGSAPFVLALVGPTGAGKTTTAAKLAINADAFGGRRVGFITLDTHRAGAVEQLQGYADAAELPLEVVYDVKQLDAARKRLSSCEVIIVDTPGRGPRANDSSAAWRDVLSVLSPDETHLVMPATTRLDLVTASRADYQPLGVSHALITKFDEVPADAAIAQLTSMLALPTRWLTDGQDVPTNLQIAGPRVLEPLGVAPRQRAFA